jgi:integrase
MPPPRSGALRTLRRADGTIYYRAVIRLADRSRTLVDVPARYSVAADGRTADERAAIYVLSAQEKEDETGELLAKKRKRQAEEAAPARESCDRYFGRLTKVRESEGVRDTRKERTIWGKWISRRIGARHIAGVTRDEIEAIRDALDEQVRLRIKDGLRAGISGATAQNVWSVLRTTFKETVSARDKTLRVRGDDPTVGHKPPLKTPKRQKTFVYPNEFAELLASPVPPREWREVYAVAAYIYVRPEELQALTWDDVDFNAGTVHVSKAISARDGKPKPLPKTANAVRHVPIEPALLPLLKRMHDEATDEGAPILPVLGELNDKFRAKQFREHLRMAGVSRPRLTAETATLLQVDFRSCRDSGITWLALAGVELARIQRRAGHEDISTTLGYVKMAEDLAGKVGTPFGPLPANLIGHRFGHSKIETPKCTAESGAGGGNRRHQIPQVGETCHDSAADEPLRDEVSARSVVAFGHSDFDVESALARALVEASAAQRWDVVVLLAKELEARRFARAGVLELDVERAKRGRAE